VNRSPGVRTLLTAATVGVALLALCFAAALTGPLLRSSTERAVRESLARDADLVARLPLAERLTENAEAGTLLPAVQRRGIAAGVVTSDGEARGAGLALNEADRKRVLAGHSVSTTGTLAGDSVLIEARPLRSGAAVVLATPAGMVDESLATQRRRLLLALGLGLLVAVAAGALVARSLSRPLAGLAGTARLLTDGHRGVAQAATGRGPREVVEVADALHRLDESLATSEQRQRRFLLSVSHELRTPLTSIRGYAESLVEGVHGADEVPEVGATLVQEAARMERYVADLLALGRLEAEDFALVLADVDVAALLAEGARAWSERFGRAGMGLTVVAPPYLPLRTDSGRVRQVLDVLTDNALRAGTAGDRVVWAAGPIPGGVRLEVRDSGPGLTEADTLDAFEPGVLHDRYAAGRPGGHGLGLAIAHRLVTRLGGEISLARAAEGGAAFTVDLRELPEG
jgi:two-component system, OmpR family, sensor kinase